MVKIRHIAVSTDDPEKTATFYQEVFGLERVGETHSADADGIYLSDGDINLALLKFKGNARREIDEGRAPEHGLHHIGFLVDDVAATKQRLAEHNAPKRSDKPISSTMFFEEKFTGPEEMIMDVAGVPWPGARPLPTATSAPGS